MTKYPHEKAMAAEVIHKSIARAAESLSFLLKEPVSFNWDNEVKMIVNDSLIDTDKDRHQNYVILITDIKGDLSGTCNLILSEREAEKLKTQALPEELKADEKAMSEMGEAFLLEADNIISASAITEFANFLKMHFYGNVPRLKKSTHENLLTYLDQELKSGYYALYFKTSFISPDLTFSPEFVWFMDQRFIDCMHSQSRKLYPVN